MAFPPVIHGRTSPECHRELSAVKQMGRERIGKGGGILFREYCFGEENSLSLTEFWGKLGEFCEKLGEFALAHK